MFYKPISKLLVLLLCLSLSTCNWFSKKDEPNPQLPPETQTGANTFGCKVNGQIWTPAGDRPGFVPNVDVIYDAGFCGGNLDAKIFQNQNENESFFVLFGCSLTESKTFSLDGPNGNPDWRLSYIDGNTACSYSVGNDLYSNGTVTFTKVDFPNRIVSGRFECTLYVPGCDTLRITEGRFDFRI
jgi:hypothetical protein